MLMLRTVSSLNMARPRGQQQIKLRCLKMFFLELSIKTELNIF
ncbi:hypothetical protein B932_3558 (plasmid) [Gluconobacter oxydans H24]|nr:hypothetical protein B932_3558 [Gluconobacter oxydans H24]